MFADLFAVLAPVFITAGIGFGWIKLGRTLDTNQFTPIIVFIGSPCLVFSTLLNSGVDVAILGQVAGIALLAHGSAMVIGFVMLKLAKMPVRTFLPSLMLPNTGNMGLPLCLFAFGDVGLALGIAYFTVSSVLQFTVGASVAAGGLSMKRLLSTPHIYVVSLAIVLLVLGVDLPRWAENTVKLIGQFTIPLMLLILGVSLARLKVGGVGRAVVLSIMRMGSGFVVGLLIVWGFDLEGAMAGVILIQSSMPVAVFNYLFAQYYNNNPQEVAGLVVISTAISFATLPLLLAYVI